MNPPKSPFRRIAAIAAGALIGLAGVSVLASPGDYAAATPSRLRAPTAWTDTKGVYRADLEGRLNSDARPTPTRSHHRRERSDRPAAADSPACAGARLSLPRPSDGRRGRRRTAPRGADGCEAEGHRRAGTVDGAAELRAEHRHRRTAVDADLAATPPTATPHGDEPRRSPERDAERDALQPGADDPGPADLTAGRRPARDRRPSAGRAQPTSSARPVPAGAPTSRCSRSSFDLDELARHRSASPAGRRVTATLSCSTPEEKARSKNAASVDRGPGRPLVSVRGVPRV